MRQVILLAVFVCYVLAQNTVYNKVALAAAVANGAVCIDGTPGAYYFRPGFGSGVNKWYIHHEGGGWCSSYGDCYGRSLGGLGSSKAYPDTMDNNGGYFSTSPQQNPLMYNWNSVYLKYCDGGSFSGNNETVSYYQGHPLYFRGIRILTAAFEDLFNKRNLKGASDVVVSGCSAGGLATYLHLDWWKERLPTATRVVGMPDSGFFLDFQGPPRYHDLMIWTFTYMNSTAGVNDKCISAYRQGGETWHCFFAEHTSPFIATPIFPLQSEYDSWQIGNDLGSSNPTEVNNYGNKLTDLVKNNLLRVNPKNSVALDSCEHHCGGWNSITFNGLTQAEAFKAWYDGSNAQYIQNKPFPCAECCN